VLSRKGFTAGLLAAGLAVSACGGGGDDDGDGGTASANQEPFRIGLVLPATGPLTPNGTGNKEGFDFFWAQNDNTAGGRPVEVIDADDEGKPDVAVTRVQELVEQEQVDVIAGFVSSAAALAARDLAVRTDTPLVVTQAATSRLTGEDDSGLVSRVIATFEESMSALTEHATTEDDVQNIVFLGSDYEAGKDADAAVRATAEANGAEVTSSIFAPLGTQDFAPFLANVGEADAVIAFFGGTDAVRFVQQYEEFGLKEQVPLYGHWSLTVDPLLAEQGDAAEGVVTVQEYSNTIDNAASQGFIEAWTEEFGSAPNAWNEQGYVAAMAIAAALEATDGEASGSDLAEAIRSVELDAPRGTVTFDDEGQVVQELYIAEVRQEGDGFVNALLDSSSN
jgi:branched-chain amino acid transport system substrate-binding protein